MSSRSITDYVERMEKENVSSGMWIDDLIDHLKIMKNECPSATCSVGVNPRCLLVNMGCKMVMLKLDGEW